MSDDDLMVGGKRRRPKKTKAEKPRKEKKAVAPPLKMLLGWVEVDTAKDARAYARGVVARSFLAHEESWYAVMPFYGGFLWEAHEGGGGRGYMRSAAKALDEMPGGEFWFRSGERVYRIVLQDAKPFPHLLPNEKSLEVMNSGVPPLETSYQMTPYVRKGTGWLVSGLIAAALSSVFFLGSVGFYFVAYNPGPSVRNTDITVMPHMQWNRVAGTGVEQIVHRLLMKNGKEWSVELGPHHIDGLDELRKQRADLERSNRDSAIVADEAKKAADAAADAQDEQDLMKQINDAKTAAGQPVTPIQQPPAPVIDPTPAPVAAPAPVVVTPVPVQPTAPAVPHGVPVVTPVQPGTIRPPTAVPATTVIRPAAAPTVTPTPAQKTPAVSGAKK